MTIEEQQRAIEKALDALRAPQYAALRESLGPLIPPEGYTPQVTLQGDKRRKKKTAPVESWRPESNEIRIRFSPSPRKRPFKQDSLANAASASTPLADLLRALDRVESRPGFTFVALKWFRDVALTGEGFDWARSDAARQEALRHAIEHQLILTSRIPNPKAPQFPVTSIRLNRVSPRVKAILGGAGPVQEDFTPIHIRGEALSSTVLRDRR